MRLLGFKSTKSSVEVCFNEGSPICVNVEESLLQERLVEEVPEELRSRAREIFRRLGR